MLGNTSAILESVLLHPWLLSSSSKCYACRPVTEGSFGCCVRLSLRRLHHGIFIYAKSVQELQGNLIWLFYFNELILTLEKAGDLSLKYMG